MPCFHPWQHKRFNDRPFVTLPCGQCLGCRMDKAADWTTRIVHEASQHEDNSFVTLTFAPEHYPADWSVDPRVLQLFVKRLRKALGHGRVRYFGCGEYGDEGGRAHYHLLLFGWAPSDAYPWRRTASGFIVSRSPFLETLWGKGHVEVGSVTQQSAGYVARYVVKKINGDAADLHYRRRECDADGQVLREWMVRPEFMLCSTKPGIGSTWFDQYAGDAFPSDFVVIDGAKRPVPRYYLKKLKAGEATPRQWVKGSLAIKDARVTRAARHADNNTPERLAVREESQHLRNTRLKRELESEK